MFVLDLFGKKSKAKAEVLAKDNASLTENLIAKDKLIDALAERNNLLMKDCDDYREIVKKYEDDLFQQANELSMTKQRLDGYVSEEAQLLSVFTTEVASDYPNITNKKLRAFIDNMIVNIELSSNSKKPPIKLEHYFALKTINNLQKYIDANGLTVRKK